MLFIIFFSIYLYATEDWLWSWNSEYGCNKCSSFQCFTCLIKYLRSFHYLACWALCWAIGTNWQDKWLLISWEFSWALYSKYHYDNETFICLKGLWILITLLWLVSLGLKCFYGRRKKGLLWSRGRDLKMKEERKQIYFGQT